MRKYKAKQSEASIEKSCRDYAHDRSWTSRKMNGLGFRSWPDRLFIPPRVKKQMVNTRGRRFWVEFKRPGEEPTPDQARQISELRERGETVYVLDNKEDFIKVFIYENERHRY